MSPLNKYKLSAAFKYHTVTSTTPGNNDPTCSASTFKLVITKCVCLYQFLCTNNLAEEFRGKKLPFVRPDSTL